MDAFSRKVGRLINRQRLFAPDDRVVVGLSGGPDSVALVLVLADLAGSEDLRLAITLAHLNHGLRGAESDADEQFCRELAGQLRMPLEVGRAGELDGGNGSLEGRARQVRYAFLGRIAREAGARAVATGHHADDAAETVLLRLLRGSAIGGLGAIAPCRPLGPAYPGVRLVRPLLDVTRAEVLQFLEDRGQTYCIDRSNRDTGFTRNRIRHELIPELSRTFPTFSSAALAALNESARESAEFIAAALDEKWAGILRASAEGAIVLEAGALSSLPAALRKEAMRRAVGLADPEASRALRADHIRAAAWLADAAVGTQIGLPRGLTARRDHGAVVIGAATPGRCQAEYTLPLPGRVSLPEAALVIHAEKMASDAPGPEDVREHSSPWEVYVDGTALTGPLTVRYRRPGDRFRPLGAPGTRSLKRFLIDCKVPRHRRDRIPLVLAPDGRILWAVGLRIADAFRLTGRSEQAVRLWETPLAGSTGQ